MQQAVLEEVGPGGEPLVAQVAGVGLDAKVNVLVLQQDVLVAEAAVADVALKRLLLLVRQLYVPGDGRLGGHGLPAQRAHVVVPVPHVGDGEGGAPATHVTRLHPRNPAGASAQTGRHLRCCGGGLLLLVVYPTPGPSSLTVNRRRKRRRRRRGGPQPLQGADSDPREVPGGRVAGVVGGGGGETREGRVRQVPGLLLLLLLLVGGLTHKVAGTADAADAAQVAARGAADQPVRGGGEHAAGLADGGVGQEHGAHVLVVPAPGPITAMRSHVLSHRDGWLPACRVASALNRKHVKK